MDGDQWADAISATSPAALAAALGEADFVVCALPHTAQTVGTFGAAEFEAMKPTAVFVNVGRGSNVDEPALIAALRGGRIAAAALDVVSQEPLPADAELWSLGDDKLICPGRRGRLSAISVFLCKSVLYGAFVWARRALNSQKRRFPARADPDSKKFTAAT